MNFNLKETNYYLYRDRIKGIISPGLKAYVLTFGCQQNESDSEYVRGILTDLGYSITECDEEADIIIINTCAIRELAEKKVLSLLGRFKPMKKAKPSLIIGVIGCVAAEAHVVERLRRDFHYVTFTLMPNRLFELPRLIYSYLDGEERTFLLDNEENHVIEALPRIRSEELRAWVSIMYGCNNFCSYCIVPYTRGREHSRDSVEIINECKDLVSRGYKEITLLGQNVNSYKSDLDFADLLRAIAEIPGNFIIRFMTSHPKDATEKLIDVMAEYTPKIAPYFHLPLQSGSDSILKAMNRRYNTERFLSVAKSLKEKIPGIALSTDIIVGFPGESDEDFQGTLDILKTVGFDFVYAFIFSERVGTPAAKMENKVAKEVKSARITELLAMQDEIALDINKRLENTVVTALVFGAKEKRGELFYEARTLNNKLVHFKADRSYINEFIKIKITRAAPYMLYGDPIIESED